MFSVRKDLVTNGLLAIGSLLLFVLAIEVTLRITGLQTVKPNPPRIYITDSNPSISYKLKPNLINEPAYKASISTDELGLRLNDRAENTVMLGDSIAFGYGVNDDETLAAHLGLVNAAVPGYQLEQQQALYEDYASKLSPDAVMIVFYWNDLDGLKPGKLDSDGILRGHDWRPEDDNRPWLERHSAFYLAFKKLIALKTSKEHQEQERQQIPDQDPVVERYLERYIDNLTAFAEQLPANRTFVIWPDNFLHEQSKLILSAGAAHAGFKVVDLYELFSNQVETLSWDTVHPSAASLKQAADFINAQR